jgi:hypothetical protein
MRHRFFIAVCLLLALFVSCGQKTDKRDTPAQQQPSASTTSALQLATDSARYFFEGVIGEKAQIYATIEFMRDTIIGSYFYGSQGKALRLDGRVQADGSVYMKEYAPPSDVRTGGGSAEERFSGEFRGTLDRAQGRIQGTWASANGKAADGKITLPFTLQATARYERIKHPTLDVRYSFPVFMQPALKALNDTLARMSKQRYDSSVISVSQMRKEMLDDNAAARAKGDTDIVRSQTIIDALSETSDIDVEYVSPSLVSFRVAASSFSGGAHGMYGCSGVTFEMKNGVPVQVRLADIFQTQNGRGYAEHLSTLVHKDLKRQGASSMDDIKPAEFTNRFATLDGVEFTVRPFGLTFYFNPYDVGSYAEGMYEVRVPWSSLKAYLKPNGIARAFVQP